MAYLKQKFEDGDVLTAEKLNHIEDGISDLAGSYYTSLYSALQDIKNGVKSNSTNDPSSASVIVEVFNDRHILTLLSNVSEENSLIIDSTIELVLNGFTVSMSNQGDNISVSSGASLIVDGTKEGSSIYVTTNASSIVMFRAKGGLTVNGGLYTINGSVSGNALFIAAADSCPILSVKGCLVKVKNDNDNIINKAFGIQSQATKSEFIDSSFEADGTTATGLYYLGEATIENVSCTVTGSTDAAALIAFANSTTTMSNVELSADSAAGEVRGADFQIGATADVKKAKIRVNGNGNAVYLRNTAEVSFDDLEIYAESDVGNVTGMIISSDSVLTGTNLRLSAVTYAEKADNKGAYGISNLGTCTIEGSVIFTDAKSEKPGETTSVGIDNSGTMNCRNTQVVAVYSSIQNVGNLFVRRCLLSGVSHGGLYTLHPHDKEVVVNDSVLEAGVYRGQFIENFTELFKPTPDPLNISALSPMFFGRHNYYLDGGDVYMDNCVFVGLAGESIVVRPAAYTQSNILGKDEQGNDLHINRLFISRSKTFVQKSWGEIGQIAPIRLNQADVIDPDTGSKVENTEFSSIYCGLGCNITTDILGNALSKPFLHFDSKYWRKKNNLLPTFEDYRVLLEVK